MVNLMTCVTRIKKLSPGTKVFSHLVMTEQQLFIPQVVLKQQELKTCCQQITAGMTFGLSGGLYILIMEHFICSNTDAKTLRSTFENISFILSKFEL